jgi:hypothetical protein
MGTTVRWMLPCAGLLAIAGAGCAGMRGERAEQGSPMAQRVAAQQETSQKALQAANDAQKKASEQEQRSAEAQADVRKAQQALTEAQQRAVQEQAKAQQLQQEANVLTQRASQEAQQAQRVAAETLTEQGQQVRRGEQSAAGEVTRATPNQLAIRSRSGDSMTFRITDRTQILLDGQPASAAEIQQGADARVAYEIGGPQPTAIHVQVMSGNPARPPAAKPSPPSDAGTGAGTPPAQPPGSPDTSGSQQRPGYDTGAPQGSQAPPPEAGPPPSGRAL